MMLYRFSCHFTLFFMLVFVFQFEAFTLNSLSDIFIYSNNTSIFITPTTSNTTDNFEVVSSAIQSQNLKIFKENISTTSSLLIEQKQQPSTKRNEWEYFLQFEETNLINDFEPKIFKANQPKTIDPKSGTAIAISYFVLKWSLIGFIILIPILLLPVMLLFARANNHTQDDTQQYDQNKLDRHQLAKQSSTMWINLPKPRALFSTALKNDAYLHDASNKRSPHGIVRIDLRSGEPYYSLLPSNSLKHTITGQLYHAPAGLVFMPIHEYLFDRNSQTNVHIASGLHTATRPNQVYCIDTNKLYERCLAMGFDLVYQWFLPRQPAAIDSNGSTNDHAPIKSMPPIRRLTMDELPLPLDRYCYRKLLLNDASYSNFKIGRRKNSGKSIYRSAESIVNVDRFDKPCLHAPLSPSSQNSIYKDANSSLNENV